MLVDIFKSVFSKFNSQIRPLTSFEFCMSERPFLSEKQWHGVMHFKNLLTEVLGT